MTQLGIMSNDLSKGIRSEINDKNSVLSIESLNAYVHNEFFYPKADNLVIGWDNIETFFVSLWESINKNKDMEFLSPLRYPGGKAKVADFVRCLIEKMHCSMVLMLSHM